MFDMSSDHLESDKKHKSKSKKVVDSMDFSDSLDLTSSNKMNLIKSSEKYGSHKPKNKNLYDTEERVILGMDKRQPKKVSHSTNIKKNPKYIPK
jgi:hypothetical protein